MVKKGTIFHIHITTSTSSFHIFSQLLFRRKKVSSICANHCWFVPSWMEERNSICFYRLKYAWIQTFPTLVLYTRQGHAHTYNLQSTELSQVWQQRKKRSPKRHFTNEISWRHDNRNLIMHHFATLCSVLGVYSVQCTAFNDARSISFIFAKKN